MAEMTARRLTREHVRELPANPLSGSWVQYRKRSLTWASPLSGPAVIETREGEYVLPADWQGYLAVDSAGWPYPIALAEFEATYVAESDG